MPGQRTVWSGKSGSSMDPADTTGRARIRRRSRGRPRVQGPRWGGSSRAVPVDWYRGSRADWLLRSQQPTRNDAPCGPGTSRRRAGPRPTLARTPPRAVGPGEATKHVSTSRVVGIQQGVAVRWVARPAGERFRAEERTPAPAIRHGLGSRIRERGRHRIRPDSVGIRGAACVGIAVPSPGRLSGRSGSRSLGAKPRPGPARGTRPGSRPRPRPRSPRPAAKDRARRP